MSTDRNPSSEEQGITMSQTRDHYKFKGSLDTIDIDPTVPVESKLFYENPSHSN